MVKSSFGRFNSFRKTARLVSALPATAASKPAQVWRPKLHDRVLTPSGAGTVMQISGDLYLIDLEDQVANVWERLASVKLHE